MAIPDFFELAQVPFGSFAGGSLVDRFQIDHESLFIFPGNVFQTVADLVDDATLDFGFGEHSQDSLLEAGQTIHAGDQDILHTPALQISDHAQPEIGTFTAIPDPMP